MFFCDWENGFWGGPRTNKIYIYFCRHRVFLNPNLRKIAWGGGVKKYVNRVILKKSLSMKNILKYTANIGEPIDDASSCKKRLCEDPPGARDSKAQRQSFEPPGVTLLDVILQAEYQFSRYLSLKYWFRLSETCWEVFRLTEDVVDRKFYLPDVPSSFRRRTPSRAVVYTEDLRHDRVGRPPGLGLTGATWEHDPHATPLTRCYFSTNARSVTRLKVVLNASRNNPDPLSTIYVGPMPPNLMEVSISSATVLRAYIAELPKTIAKIEAETVCVTRNSFLGEGPFPKLSEAWLTIEAPYEAFEWGVMSGIRKLGLNVKGQHSGEKENPSDLPACLESLHIAFDGIRTECSLPRGLVNLSMSSAIVARLPEGLKGLCVRNCIFPRTLPKGIQNIKIERNVLLQLDGLPPSLVSLYVSDTFKEDGLGSAPFPPPKSLLCLNGYFADTIWDPPPATVVDLTFTLVAEDPLEQGGNVPVKNIPPSVKILLLQQCAIARMLNLDLTHLPVGITELNLPACRTVPLGDEMLRFVCLRKLFVGQHVRGGIVTLPRSIELVVTNQYQQYIRINGKQLYMYGHRYGQKNVTFIKRTYTDQPGCEPISKTSLSEGFTLYQLLCRHDKEPKATQE